MLTRLLLDDEGQDLVEYGLATALIGIAGYLVVTNLGDDILRAYSSWISPDEGVPLLWDPPDPMASGGS